MVVLLFLTIEVFNLLSLLIFILWDSRLKDLGWSPAWARRLSWYRNWDKLKQLYAIWPASSPLIFSLKTFTQKVFDSTTCKSMYVAKILFKLGFNNKIVLHVHVCYWLSLVTSANTFYIQILIIEVASIILTILLIVYLIALK